MKTQTTSSGRSLNGLLIANLAAALIAVASFLFTLVANDTMSYGFTFFGAMLFYVSAGFLAICVLLTPVYIRKRSLLAKPLLIITAVVNVFSLCGLIWFVLHFWLDV